MKIKNKNSVFGGYVSGFHPIQNLKIFLRALRYMWQRGVKGYCDRDIWNLDEFLIQLLGDSIEELGTVTHSYPAGFGEGEEAANMWKTYLLDMAAHFHAATRDSEYFTNEYEEEYGSFDMEWEEHTDEFGCRYTRLKDTIPAEVRKKFLEREKELAASRDVEFEIGLRMLGESIRNLWD